MKDNFAEFIEGYKIGKCAINIILEARRLGVSDLEKIRDAKVSDDFKEELNGAASNFCYVLDYGSKFHYSGLCSSILFNPIDAYRSFGYYQRKEPTQIKK